MLRIHGDISSADSCLHLLDSALVTTLPRGAKDPAGPEFSGHGSLSFPSSECEVLCSLLLAPGCLAFSVMTSAPFFSQISGPLRICLWSPHPFFHPLISWFLPELEYMTSRHLCLSNLSLKNQIQCSRCMATLPGRSGYILECSL